MPRSGEDGDAAAAHEGDGRVTFSSRLDGEQLVGYWEAVGEIYDAGNVVQPPGGSVTPLCECEDATEVDSAAVSGRGECCDECGGLPRFERPAAAAGSTVCANAAANHGQVLPEDAAGWKVGRQFLLRWDDPGKADHGEWFEAVLVDAPGNDRGKRGLFGISIPADEVRLTTWKIVKLAEDGNLRLRLADRPPVEECFAGSGDAAMVDCVSCAASWHRQCAEGIGSTVTDDDWMCPECVNMLAVVDSLAALPPSVPFAHTTPNREATRVMEECKRREKTWLECGAAEDVSERGIGSVCLQSADRISQGKGR
eukprot:COSAG04_NODE_746_length_10633_cov_8.922456_2_plen_311_part_00